MPKTANKIGVLIFSKHTSDPLRERIHSRFIAEIKNIGCEAVPLYYDLFQTFYEQNKAEVYYDNKKLNVKEYLFFIGQYYFLNNEFSNNIFFVRVLEKLGAKVFNSVAAVSVAKSKRESTFALSQAGLPVIPTGINFSQFFLDEQLRRRQGQRIICKANIGSWGYGVTILDSAISFISFMEYIGIKEQPANILIQPYLDAASSDYRIFVVDGRVQAAMERRAEGIEFRPNINKGGHGQSIKPNKQLVDLAVKATKIIGLDYAGVDILKSDNKYYLVEVNSNPGLEIEKITGINVAEKIVQYCIKKTK